MQKSKARRCHVTETGSVLLIVAGSMVVLLAISAFAIDLANFYLARAEAQRAADAAALAGAKGFVDSGCTTQGCVQGGPQDAMARQMAESTGAQNYVAGRPADITNKDVALNENNPNEPQVTVTVKSAVQTFFAKIFGVDTANISAAATAEAYSPGSTGGSQLGASCLKPFLVSNCDPDHTSPENKTYCGSGYGYFFYPGIPGEKETVENPGPYSEGGIVGEHWELHTGAAPSQWYLVGFDGAPPSSGSALRNHIVDCTSETQTCGLTLTTANGNNVGPVSQGINDLIDANGYGMNEGQDSIDTSTYPFTITGGSNNPNSKLVDQTFTDYSESPSVATVPVYAGGPLSEGGSVVGIVGYLQIFIQDVVHNGTDNHIDVVILNAATCGGDSGNSPAPSGPGEGTVVGSAGSPIPIRLIRTN